MLTAKQRQCLAMLRDRGSVGMAAHAGLRMTCNSLAKHDLARVKVGYEATFVITPEGKAWLAKYEAAHPAASP